jgi:hypothetical protein
VRRLAAAQCDLFDLVLQIRARRRRSHELPARLKVGEFKTLQMDAERCRVVSYNGFDPLELSPRLLGVLGYFDGRPTAAALRRLAAQERVKLNEALIRRLVDHGILVACE